MTSQSPDSHWQRPDDSTAARQGRSGSARLVDPEDDLPSATYTGDFETTTIPPYDSTNSGAPALGAGYSLVDHPEPLPYVQPQYPPDRASGRTAGTRNAGTAGVEDNRASRTAGRRGTQDLGLLILRVGLGVLMFVHGLQKVVHWWGGQGLGGFKNALSDAGYQHADILTFAGAGGQIVAGALLVLGLFTPVAAAGALAYLINAALAGVSAHAADGFAYFLTDGREYQIMLVVVAIVIVLAGPGRYGLDAGRGWARRPFIGSFAALLLGAGGGVWLWVLLNGVNPLG